MAPLLLLVPSTFLTIIGLSSFYSLNPCFAAILLSINIPVTLLSKSALTITLLCISIFFTPMFNHTSLSILKVLLTFFCLPPFFAAPFSSLGCTLLCYTFPSVGCTAFLSTIFKQPHHFIASNCLLKITSCPLFSSI